MRILRYLFFVPLLLIGMFHSVDAQSVLSPEQREKVIENVTTFINDLNLSENDKPAFRAIIEDFFIGLVALSATDFPVSTNRKILKALIQGRNSRAKGLLSSDQYKVYKAQLKKTQANIRAFLDEKM